ncbi:MAG: hypothetical protein PWP23_662 [Candidatus Sumerlaeota bacterium]|nr:hypothetical protein [Candidatus Sumerlaeota bacterium]
MTCLLVIGVGPRPGPGQTHVYAPGLRLHTVAGELIRAGHQVHAAECLFGGRDEQSVGQPFPGAASHTALPGGIAAMTSAISRLCHEHAPQAIVALTDGVALAAARAEYDGPLYIDYNGHPMAERQMQGAIHGNNDALASQWEYVLPVLLRADRFATCSGAQRLALIGELGAAGRIGAETCGHELVDVLRPPLPFEEEFRLSEPGRLRGGWVPADSRVILFTGGYNTWLDEALLFAAVERVLAADPKAVYVSTGGGIDGHVTEVFARFRARTESSPHRDRYRFVGWLDHEAYVDCCLEADVGVMTDRWTLEGELGCRNRLYGWLWGGMRAVATDLAEIVHRELGPLGLVKGTPTGDVDAYAAALAGELEAGRFGDDEAARRRELLRTHCSPKAYYQPLLDWATSPEKAPDRSSGMRPGNPLSDWMAFVDRLGVPGVPGAGADELRIFLDRLAGSRAFQLYLKTNPDLAAQFERVRSCVTGSPEKPTNESQKAEDRGI